MTAGTTPGTTRTFRILSATETDVVSLGQTRDDVRSVLGDFRTFRRTPQLVGESVESLVEALGAKGIDVVPDEMGALVPSLSVGLYAPGGTVEGVGIGSD
jgi:hypothetical protein